MGFFIFWDLHISRCWCSRCHQPNFDPVQDLKLVAESVLLKTILFQIVKHQLHGTGCHVPEVVAGIPCCSSQYLFKQLGIFLFVTVRVPLKGIPCNVGGGPDLGSAVSEAAPEKKNRVLFPWAATVSILFVQERSVVTVTFKCLLGFATLWLFSVKTVGSRRYGFFHLLKD